MTTCSDLIDDISTYLYGFGVERDKETALSFDMIDSTALSFQVNDAKQVDRGVVEIDDEIMAVSFSDPNTNTITVQPWGRGHQGTTPAVHFAGARVAANPRFPRATIMRHINQIITGLYPSLYQVVTDTSNVINPAVVTYPVPAKALSLVSVAVQALGPSKMWVPITRRSFDYSADLTSFPTGRSVDLYGGGLPAGRKVKIVYRTDFDSFTDSSQAFSDVGLDEGYRDLIGMAVEARLVAALDSPRLQLGAVESTARAQYNQPGMASQIAKSLFQQYQLRLTDEKDRLQRQYPGSIVRMT